MYRYITALQEVLKAKAGAGELLADVTADRIYLMEAPKTVTLPCIVIWPFDRTNIATGHTAGYRLTDMDAEVNVYVAWNEYDKMASLTAVTQLGDKVERVLLDNGRLKCTSYNNGFIMMGGTVKIETLEPFTAIVHGSAVNAYLYKLAVAGRVIIRDGNIDI